MSRGIKEKDEGFTITWRLFAVALALFSCLIAPAALAQNPVPQIVGAEVMAMAPGSGAFTLSVCGANFVPGAAVHWNGQPRSTGLSLPANRRLGFLPPT